MNCLTKKLACIFLLFCIKHGSVVSECVNDVYNIFRMGETSGQHFLFAFKALNNEYFTSTEINNKNGLGYFKHLIRRFTNFMKYHDSRGKIIMDRPSIYYNKNGEENGFDNERMEALYMLLADTNEDRDEEVTRILNMTEIKTIKYVYLTQIYSHITIDNYYSELDIPTLENNSPEAIEKYKLAIDQYVEEFNRRHRIISHMQFYFEHLIIAVRFSSISGNYRDQCIDDVYKIFPKDDPILDDPKDVPIQNFFTAFRKYNQEYFRFQENNYHALGYFEDLVNSVEVIGDVIVKPNKYCIDAMKEYDILVTTCNEALYMLLADKKLNREEGNTRIQNMTEIEAIKYVYLTQIFDEITLNNIYPKEYEPKKISGSIRDTRKYLHALQLKYTEDEKKEEIIMVMQMYFTQLIEAVELIADSIGFRTVEQYCTAAAALNET